MTRQEFDAIVDDAVKNGADRKAAEEYVVLGFKLDGIPKTPARPKARKPKR